MLLKYEYRKNNSFLHFLGGDGWPFTKEKLPCYALFNVKEKVVPFP